VSAGSSGATPRIPSWLPRLGVAAAIAATIAWAAIHRAQFTPERLEASLRALGPWAPLAFVLIYTLAALLFVPGSVITIASGALFGPLFGTLWNIIGATLGATLSFLAARYIVGDFIVRRAGPRLKSLVEGVEAEGWRFVAFVRLVPLFPFNLLNYALGLTRIRLVEYVLASAICMLPGAFAYTYLGYAGREAAARGAGAIRDVVLAVGLLLAAALVPRLVRRARATGTDQAGRKIT
jgi:uncharacterized membrane protein YdjX (TVP38/TMEM64 family)